MAAMAMIRCGENTFDIDLIAFDKDGTLLEFGPLWGGLARRCVAGLAEHVGRADLIPPLYAALGFDADLGEAISGGPLAVTSMAGLDAIARAELDRIGLAPQAAQAAIAHSFGPCMRSSPTLDMLVPIGPVEQLLTNLVAAGLIVAVITSDHRHPTVATLRTLGWDRWITYTVCADDPFPGKPAPDGLYHLRDHTGIPTAHMAIVGDNPGDARTGLAAGAAGRIGVLSGNSTPADFVTVANAVIPSIQDIQIL